MKWFRLWIDILDDPKCNVSNMPYETFHLFVSLMAYASELEKNGIIRNQDDPTWRLRITPEKLKKHVKILLNLDIISQDKTGITFKNWNKRQFTSDKSTERVKRFRSAKRNVPETANETAPETETDTETDNTMRDKKQSRCFGVFESLWERFPVKREKQKALAEFKKLKWDNGFEAIVFDALDRQLYYYNECKRNNQFIPEFPYLQRWIKNKRWEDEIKIDHSPITDEKQHERDKAANLKKRMAEGI